MRFLLSTVAATALMASPALAQTLENDAVDAPEAAEPMDRMNGIEFGQLEQDLTGAGFTDAEQLRQAEIYSTTYQGQSALVIVLDEDMADVTMDDPIDDPDVTAAVPEDDEFDDDLALDDEFEDDDLALDDEFEDDELAADPADPAIDDDLAEAPDDPAIDDPAIDDEFAEAPEDPAMDDPDVTATVPGVGIEDELSQAGFEMPERTDQGQVFRTTTEDGRTMLIVMGYDDTADIGVDPADPVNDEFEAEEPALDDDLEQVD